MPGWRRLLEEHPYAVVGTVLGFIWGILALRFGFLAAIFLLAITVFGLWVGRQFDLGDEGADLSEFLERVLNRHDRD